MNYVLHTSDSRSQKDYGWLQVRHTFSFADYYNPQRMQFGALRVLNDDTIAGGRGFGMHPHDNMEIITIPLSGGLRHTDNMGNSAVINSGDVQVMSAGSGLFHSEMNAKKDENTSVLQIWILPNKKNVSPRYDHVSMSSLKHNSWNQLVGPYQKTDGCWIYQEAWLQLGTFDKGTEISYTLHDKNNGVYAFVLEGDVVIQEQFLNKRDGIGLWELEEFKGKIEINSKILLLEVPMMV